MKTEISKKKKVADDLINWSQLSLHLTGKSQNIRRDNIPKKFLIHINGLRHTVANWLSYCETFGITNKK